MILLEDLTYGGRSLKAGETFDATSTADAQILRAIGKARNADATEEAEGEEEISTASPKRYNRRDLRARK
jgi:hypothetical protein